MKNFTIIDNFGYKEDYSYLESLLEMACKKLKTEGIFSISFIGDEEMHEMNFKYRNVDRTTDVLSFALNDVEDEFDCSVNLLGDIFISIPKMKSQAVEYKHSEKRELSFLCVHGLLHLLGYDHMSPEDEKIMFGLQKEVLDCAGIKE